MNFSISFTACKKEHQQELHKIKETVKCDLKHHPPKPPSCEDERARNSLQLAILFSLCLRQSRVDGISYRES